MIQSSQTTRQMLIDILDYAAPIWVTVDEATNEMPTFRSEQSTRRAMNTLHREGKVERRVRDTCRSPFEYRATEGAPQCM